MRGVVHRAMSTVVLLSFYSFSSAVFPLAALPAAASLKRPPVFKDGVVMASLAAAVLLNDCNAPYGGVYIR